MVEQFVDVIVESLLTFPGAPHFDSLLSKPLNHEGRLVIASADAVEHEYQQHIELVQNGSFLDLYDGVSGVGADLIARDTFF